MEADVSIVRSQDLSEFEGFWMEWSSVVDRLSSVISMGMAGFHGGQTCFFLCVLLFLLVGTRVECGVDWEECFAVV